VRPDPTHPGRGCRRMPVPPRFWEWRGSETATWSRGPRRPRGPAPNAAAPADVLTKTSLPAGSEHRCIRKMRVMPSGCCLDEAAPGASLIEAGATGPAARQWHRVCFRQVRCSEPGCRTTERPQIPAAKAGRRVTFDGAQALREPPPASIPARPIVRGRHTEVPPSAPSSARQQQGASPCRRHSALRTEL